VDWLIVNEIEGANIAQCAREAEILPSLQQKFPKMNVLLTLGKRGAVCRLGGEETKIGIFDVPVADTTAAGDTFLGYFLVEALDGVSLQSALRLASAASSLCVQTMGAADSVPCLADAQRALQSGALGELGEWGGWR